MSSDFYISRQKIGQALWPAPLYILPPDVFSSVTGKTAHQRTAHLFQDKPSVNPGQVEWRAAVNILYFLILILLIGLLTLGGLGLWAQVYGGRRFDCGLRNKRSALRSARYRLLDERDAFETNRQMPVHQAQRSGLFRRDRFQPNAQPSKDRSGCFACLENVQHGKLRKRRWVKDEEECAIAIRFELYTSYFRGEQLRFSLEH